eukprot:7174288-Lingulodinium_polyedra.AAC.1
MAQGLLTGANKQQAWTRQLLQGNDVEGESLRFTSTHRIEFQDGTRRQRSQDYHGNGRPHT